MRQPVQIFLATLVCISFNANSQNKPSNTECDLSGCVGDVKYSILGLTDFQKINGTGWVLLIGQNLSNDRGLENFSPFLYPIMQKLPDARGNFLRSMNVNGGNDPFPTENNRERQVGEFQGDSFAEHTHPYDDAHFAEINGGNQHLFGNQGPMDDDNGRLTTRQNTFAAGGKETRPKSISLYLYVKIN